MDYGKIISQAWRLVWKNRSLWVLGILAGLTEGGGNFGNLGEFSSSGEAPASAERAEISIENVLSALSQNWLLTAVIAAGLIIVFLIIAYLSYSAKAGLILAVRESEKRDQPKGFRRYFQLGRPFGWRVLGLNFLLGLAVVLILIILGLPLYRLFQLSGSSAGIEVLTIIMMAVGLLLLLGVIFYFSVLVRLGERRLVLSNSKILSSLRQSHRLLVRYAGQTLVLLLIEIGLSIGLSVLILLTLLIVGGILLGIGYGIYSIAQLPGALIYSIPVGLAFLAGLIIAAGIFTALISVYWTLAYQILTRKHDLRKI